MAVERPTFHEAWYRVAELRPRLLSGVRMIRQHYRGRLWYVLENPINTQYCRLSPGAYAFVGALDGRRTVSQAWQICNERLADEAPTQGEVIQLLGQLGSMNLLYADLPPDSAALFARQRKRVKREIQTHLMSLLFIRIPLFDPDRLLDKWVGLFGCVFSWLGLLLWLLLLSTGLYYVIGNFGELVSQSADVLAPGNLMLLYGSFVIIKIIHEFSHSFACKRFGLLNNGEGQVHSMGVMFLVFFPLPYMDASSAWAFRSKWHRAVVGLSGVMAELATAAVAAIIWSRTSTGTLHIIAYNVIFTASISTVLFNGNPLLRFDAYYVLSDLIEIPNLADRSKQYIYYLVKHHIWSAKGAYSPAHCLGERIWFVVYGIASTVYRVFISIRILMFLNDRLPEQLFVLVPIFASAAVIGWLFVPLGRFVKYLATSPELARSRTRALGSTLGGLCVLFVLTGVLKVPDHWRVEGVVEPAEFAIVYARTDGFVEGFLPSGSHVDPNGQPLVRASNRALLAQRSRLLAELTALEVQRSMVEMENVALSQILDKQIIALDERIERIESDIANLNLRAGVSGIWVSPEIGRSKGSYVSRGQALGFVGSLGDLVVRSTAKQNVAALLVEQAERQVEIRARGRPDVTLLGRIEKIYPAGLDILPSEALGYAGGGSMPTMSLNPGETRSAEKFFEIRIRPRETEGVELLTGQRVIARIRMRPKPLLLQVWQSARQLLQRRFHI